MQTPDKTPSYWNLAEQVPDFWLSDLESQRFKELLKISHIKRFEDGDVIINEATSPQPMLFFLLSGQVALLKSGKVQAVLKRRGDAFGETTLIRQLAQVITAQAVGETTCFAVDAPQVQRVSGDDKLVFGCIIYRLFAESVSASLRTTNKDLTEAYQKIEKLEADLKV